MDEPGHVGPGPAAQSFWPANDTPKHFSLVPACVIVAVPATAAATALAMASVRHNYIPFLAVRDRIGPSEAKSGLRSISNHRRVCHVPVIGCDYFWYWT